MNLQTIRKDVIDLCHSVGEDLKTDFQKTHIKSTSKGGMDFLTEADARTDEFLQKNLGQLYPQTLFLTEETSDENFSDFLDKENVWIIDPIDGTTNFSRKNPHFSISVALVSKGKPLLGVVYLPIEDKLYVSDIESPDVLLNDQPIFVSKTAELSESTFACDWSWDLAQRTNTYQKLASMIRNVRQILTLGCASADMCEVARGKMDGYFLYGIKPWDIAASSLILEKAGGKITKIDGSTWNVFEPDFIASNGILHEKVVSLLS